MIPDRIGIMGRTQGVNDRKSTRLNSSHLVISYAVFCLKKKKKSTSNHRSGQTYNTNCALISILSRSSLRQADVALMHAACLLGRHALAIGTDATMCHGC